MGVIEEYTVRFLKLLEPTLLRVPPAFYVGALLGIVNSTVFYIFLGRGLKLFIPYLVIGAGGAVLGVLVGMQLPDSGFALGEVNLVSTVVACWAILFVARSLRL
jgi:hypothetical protein